MVAGLVLCALLLAVWAVLVLSNLPDISALKQYRPAAATEVLDRNGEVLTQYFDRKLRIWIPISSLPDRVIHAVVTAEDDTFFEHDGINYKATWDALVHDVQKRRFARGGSTITQQMIKNVLLSREKTLSRKLREYVLARKAEDVLTKRQILQIYLNEVEWGDNIYGIEAASRFYFDKHAAELSVGEAAMLAGMLPNPRFYNPFKRPDKAKNRQEQVLANMLQAKLITDEEHAAGIDTAVSLRREQSGRFDFSVLKRDANRPCYQQVLEQALVGFWGERAVFRGGLTIRTTLDRNLQNSLQGLEKGQNTSTRISDRVTLVTQEEQIRGIVCSPRDDGQLAAMTGQDYSIDARSLSSIARDQIILSSDEKKEE